MSKLRTAKDIFEEELSGEPLSQDMVIMAIQIAQQEIIDSVYDMVFDYRFILENVKSIEEKLNLKIK